MPKKPAVLFVCLGNICRSPLAEAVFRAEAARQKLDAEADSAGIGNWHVGEAPDTRAQAVAKKHGVDIGGCRGRQVTHEDFCRFTHVIALDRDVLAALRRLRPANATAQLGLLLDAVPGREGEGVTDPYYGEDDGFETTFSDVASGTAALVRKLSETR